MFRQLSHQIGAAGGQVHSADLGVVAGLLERGALRVVVDCVLPLYEVVQVRRPAPDQACVA